MIIEWFWYNYRTLEINGNLGASLWNCSTSVGLLYGLMTNVGKLLNHCRTIKMTVGTIVYNCDNLIINYRSWAQSCDFYTQCSTNLMVFWSVKKMSQEIRCRSPMFRSPRLDVSGLKIMKQSLHCLVRMSTGRMWSIVIIREWSSLFLARFLVTGDNMMLHLGLKSE